MVREFLKHDKRTPSHSSTRLRCSREREKGKGGGEGKDVYAYLIINAKCFIVHDNGFITGICLWRGVGDIRGCQCEQRGGHVVDARV